MTYGCATITVVASAAIPHGSLDTLTFLIWVAWGGSIWEFHGWAVYRACFYVRCALIRRRTRLQHSIDNVCHFFTLSRSSINEQTFEDVSYGSGSCVHHLICAWVPLLSLIMPVAMLHRFSLLLSDRSPVSIRAMQYLPPSMQQRDP